MQFLSTLYIGMMRSTQRNMSAIQLRACNRVILCNKVYYEDDEQDISGSVYIKLLQFDQQKFVNFVGYSSSWGPGGSEIVKNFFNFHNTFCNATSLLRASSHVSPNNLSLTVSERFSHLPHLVRHNILYFILLATIGELYKP